MQQSSINDEIVNTLTHNLANGSIKALVILKDNWIQVSKSKLDERTSFYVMAEFSWFFLRCIGMIVHDSGRSDMDYLIDIVTDAGTRIMVRQYFSDDGPNNTQEIRDNIHNRVLQQYNDAVSSDYIYCRELVNVEFSLNNRALIDVLIKRLEILCKLEHTNEFKMMITKIVGDLLTETKFDRLLKMYFKQQQNN